MAWQSWVLALGCTLIVCWGWVLVQFMTDPVSGSFWRYLGAGLIPGFGGGGLGAFVHLVDLQIRLFGWGGFVFGSLGLLLLAFQNRSQFLLFALLGVPFIGYAVFQQHLGSQYLAEGLQESNKTMMWVMAVVMVSVQVIGNLYTDNIWHMALKRQNQLQEQLPTLQILQQHIQQQTRTEDLVVVIPDANRPGGLGMFESRWAVAWYLQRQIVWGRATDAGWEFDTVPWHQAQSQNWMSVRQEVDDAFVEQVMRSGRQLVCPEPFPFLHSDRVSMWMAALPATEEKTPLFFLYPGWPKAPDHHRVAEAFLDVFNAYVANGYWTDAAACLQGVIVYRPEDVAAHRKLGDLYMKLGQFQSAANIYSRLLILVPDDESVAINLSGAYFSQGQIEQAITVCEIFLTHYANSPEVLFNLAGYYQHANRLDMTEKMYEAYLGLGNQTVRYNEVLGLLNTLRQKP
jgi:tetratricopeptide (TPR) repeat protein